MAYVTGWQAKLTINGMRMHFSRIDWDGATDNQRTTNSEGYITGVLPAALGVPGFHTSVGGNRVLTMTFSDVSFDPQNNLFLPPYLIFPDSVIAVGVFFDAIGGRGIAAPLFHVLRYNGSLDVGALQPLSFSGETLGGTWTIS
jgi:hypothetical protein